MKRILFIVIVLLLGIISLTACGNGFKNPKTIEYKTNKGSIKLTYDDDGTFEVEENKPYIILRNKDNNFRIDIDFSRNNIKQQEAAKESFKKDNKYTVIDNLKYNKYKGYAMIQNEYTTTNIYLILDEKNEIISNIKVSPIITNNASKELEKGTKPEDVLFNKEIVQRILKTIKYEKSN